ncbi:MAG: type II toxin-antitoxin system HicB family antitoxin [Myxococcales bacterium]
MQYTVILEPEADGRFSASVPDLPGCTSEGDTYEETVANIAEAITCHIEGMKMDGLPVPAPRARFETVAVNAA